jgi:hypothetical protein
VPDQFACLLGAWGVAECPKDAPVQGCSTVCVVAPTTVILHSAVALGTVEFPVTV